MFTLYLVEDRVAKTKTLVVSDKRFSSFVADIEDRKTKNIEELQSSPDLAFIQTRISHYLRIYKLEPSAVVNPHKIILTPNDRKRLRVRIKKKPFSEEGRKNMSEAKKGENNPMYGRKQTARSNAINSMKRRQRLVQPHAMPHTQESKDKYRESRKKWKPNVGKKWAHDPYTMEERLIGPDEQIPDGWFFGRSPAITESINTRKSTRKNSNANF